MKHVLNNKVCMLITKAERYFKQGNFLRASPKKAMAWWLSAVLSKVGSMYYVAVIHFKIGFLRLPHFEG